MGIIIALIIMLTWALHLVYSLMYVNVNIIDPMFYIHILVQGYLYTGLFITGHDAMHRNIAQSTKINYIIGTISSFLFAGLSYRKLLKNHFRHHKYPGEGNDPDFYVPSQNFLLWWLVFLGRYTTVSQLIIMALLYNVLKIWFNEPAILSFWVIPAFISTLQLFYFGTYLPHRYPHTETMKPHNARTQRKNHLLGMLTCYFFGYHYEHHESPGTPWWLLYKEK